MTVRASMAWLAALFAGSVLGLGLRLAGFFAGALLLSAFGHLMTRLARLLPLLDPVYTRAAEGSLLDLHIQGAAVIAPFGDGLHAWLPDLFVPAVRAHWGIARLVVAPGTPVMGRLLASGFAHALVLTAGVLVAHRGWTRRSTLLVIAGVAMQVQVAVGILGAQPSIRELEATGVSFAASALLPALAPRGAALTDGASEMWPALVTATLVALALLLGYVPVGLLCLLRDTMRRITFGTAAIMMLGSAACAGVLKQDVPAASPPQLVETGSLGASVSEFSDVRSIATRSRARAAGSPIVDRWFDTSTADQTSGPTRVEIAGSDFHYQYLVNGQPQVIKGMGLNTQYAHQLSPDERAARIDADMVELSAIGVNTVLGWDPSEFDGVLLDAAQRHGIGVIMPFDLNPGR